MWNAIYLPKIRYIQSYLLDSSKTCKNRFFHKLASFNLVILKYFFSNEPLVVKWLLLKFNLRIIVIIICIIIIILFINVISSSLVVLRIKIIQKQGIISVIFLSMLFYRRSYRTKSKKGLRYITYWKEFSHKFFFKQIINFLKKVFGYRRLRKW